MATTGYTDIRLTHAKNNVYLDTSSKMRTVEEVVTALRALEMGAWEGTIDVLQNDGNAVAASGTVTFSGGASAADTVTINGQALTAAQKNARATATFSTVVADNVVTVNGIAFTAKVSPSGANQFALGASDTEAAANLATKVNAHASLTGIITATSAAAVATFRAVTSGTGGNALTLAKTGSPVAISGATFANGAASANNAWDFGDTAAQASAALTAAVTASSTGIVSGHVTAADNGAGIVTLTATKKHALGNAITLAKAGTNIAVSGTRLTAGVTSTTTQRLTF